MLCHLAALDAQIAAVDEQLERVANSEPWGDPVRWLCSFRGIATHTALALLAEIGDFRRFAHPRELMSYLGLTPSEYSSGQQQHRGHITKTGNRHARRLLIEAAWHYQHRPRQSASGPPSSVRTSHPTSLRAPGRPRCACTTATAPSREHGKRSTVADVAVARELAGFIWAAMTNTPLRNGEEAAAA